MMPIQLKYSIRSPNRNDQNRTSPQHIIVKTLITDNKKRILKAAKEKHKVTYKNKSIRITVNFSTENLKARRAWNELLQLLKENNCQPKSIYPEKL
jgi:EAL domain-containing protein (putative c-di-GMP-specific phosphodiesterase class I)